MSVRFPLLLIYNGFFHWRTPFSFWEGLRVRWTDDRRRLPQADIVLFHLPTMEPGDIDAVPKDDRQVWVAFTMESRANCPVLADPSFLDRFDLTMSYERSSDIWRPYLPSRRRWARALRKPLPLKTESSPVVMFQSSTLDNNGRLAFAAELAQHIPVDSYGRFMHNRDLPAHDRGTRTKREVISRYRFCIAFENTREPDYVTEKLYQPLIAGTVPIYMGAPNVEDLVPDPGCYIHAEAYGGPKGLAEYLMHLVHSPAEYDAFFDWRRRPFSAPFRELLARKEIPTIDRLLHAASIPLRQKRAKETTKGAVVAR